MKYVLSLDGGGIRGLIPALVLADIEKKTGKRIAELFDLITGTSTGGILAIGLCKDDGTGVPQYSAKDLSVIYQKHGSEIFSRSLWKGMSSTGGLSDEKYSADGIEKVLDQYFGHEEFGNSLKNVLISSYDIQNRVPVFFKSWSEKFKSVEMRHIARATSAAPTFFEPALVPVNGKTEALVDGGVFINNPSVSAYVEAMKIFPGEEITLVSIGTGELVRPIPYDEAKDWGKIGWMIPVLGCMFDGVSDAADYQMKQLLGDNYIRLQTSLSIASDDMDNATKGNINLLTQEAKKLIRRDKEKIKNMFV